MQKRFNSAWEPELAVVLNVSDCRTPISRPVSDNQIGGSNKSKLDFTKPSHNKLINIDIIRKWMKTYIMERHALFQEADWSRALNMSVGSM